MSEFDWRIDEEVSWPPRGRPKAPYGPTALEVLRSCPLRHCFERSTGYERRMSFDGRIGTAFHRTLEWLSEQHSYLESTDAAATEVREQFAKEVQAQEAKADARPRERGLPRKGARIHAAAEALLAAAHRVRGTARADRRSDKDVAEAEGRTLDGAEGDAEVEVPVSSRDGLFTGRVDRVEYIPDGVRLIDYKSALRNDLPERYERQVQLYAAMWRDTRDEHPSEGLVAYPLVGTSHSVLVDPGTCDRVVGDYRELISSVEKERSACELAIPGDTCKICEFRPWCKPFWDWQGREANSSVALERASWGFEGVVESIKQIEHHWKLSVRWRKALVSIVAPVERFPQLTNVEVGSRLRVLEAPLRGQRYRPRATVTESSEIFVVETPASSRSTHTASSGSGVVASARESTGRGGQGASSKLKQRALELLRQAVGDPTATFRQGQWEAIEDLLLRRAKMLVVQRTGWGKSMVYFLTTRLMRERAPERSVALLISPLLALMRDQVRAAERLGVRAATINSSNREEWAQVREQVSSGGVDVLLVSPERLANEDFLQDTLLPMAGRIGLFVVDEAHCISDWGHDFRPDYQRVTRILQTLPPNVPVLTTTATANDRVVTDVVAQLGSDLRVMRGPLVRESLQLQNISLPKAASRMAWLARWLPQLPGSGIVYALTIADAQNVAEWLRSRGIEAHAYWGGLDAAEREGLERKLLDNEVKALVATTALGMGFDKPDLGFVIHYQRPGSAIHYYQQVGRAGRALDRAYGVLLGGDEDQQITEYFIHAAFPPEAHARQVLYALGAADEGLSMRQLERKVNLTRGQIEKTLKSLSVKSPSPVSKNGTRWHANPVPYTPDTKKISHLTRLRYREQERMSEYMESKECLMLFLARELDDPAPAVCGQCAVCRGRAPIPETYPPHLVEEAVRFLRHAHRRIEPRKRWPDDALASLGWTGAISPGLRAEEGRSLCLWGDDGWGKLVRRGKQVDGRFPDRLVQAAAEMVREQWRPEASFAWVTCVPSLRHPELVPDFARRLAASLGLPFVGCVRTRAQAKPQKDMENSYQQARNLRDAFEVENHRVRSGPVLLVDDMVDSRWTFTVATAHLRRAGAGQVFPLALAEARRGDL